MRVLLNLGRMTHSHTNYKTFRFLLFLEYVAVY